MSGARCLILRELSHSGALSRADLSKRLKIGFPVISVETAKLLDENILVTCAYRPNASKGRKNLLLDLNESYKFALGIGVCETTLSVGISTVRGNSLAKRVVPLPSDEDLAEAAYNCACELMRECCLDCNRLFGIGVCSRGGIPKQDELAALFPDIPLTYEPADEYLDFGNVSPDGLYMFGCAKVIRNLFLYKE